MPFLISRKGSNLARIPSKWIFDYQKNLGSSCSVRKSSTKRRYPSLAGKLFDEKKTWVIKEVTVDLEYQVKESIKCDFVSK